MTEMLVGIDIGTTRVKAGLVNSDFELLAVESAPTPWRNTADGPVVDPAEVGSIALRMADKCGRRALAEGARVVGIGTAGMAETGALLDRDRNPIAPGFAWHHTLGDAHRVQDALGGENFMRTTGHGTDLAPSIMKLDYLRTEGHEFREGQRWLNLPEYITWRLTGQEAAEMSLSGRTGLFDLGHKRWWGEALEYLGAGEWLFPGDPVPAGTAVGTVRSDAVHSLAGAIVTTVGHDHVVAALSIGEYRTGSLCLSLGTSEGQIRIVEPSLGSDEILALVRLGVTVDWHPFGDRWYVLGTLPTGLTLERLSRLVGCRNTEERLALSREAMQARPTVGARLKDVSLDGFSIVDITTGDDRPALWRQAVDQLLAASQTMTDEISRIIGPPETSAVYGGWTHDPLIRRERERLSQRSLRGTPDEPGIVGAAMAAAKAAGRQHPLVLNT